MIVRRLGRTMDAAQGAALMEFEKEFTYPLGSARRFRISHGDDYERFFRAIGSSACFVAEEAGGVIGMIAAVIRRLGYPDGSQRAAAYLADLKISTSARSGWALFRLAQAAYRWAQPQAAAAFSIVMDGTRATPEAYTGRAGLPAFRQVAKVVVLRFAVEPARLAAADDECADDDRLGEERYRILSAGRYWCPGGTPTLRSRLRPRWLVLKDRGACGRLEDTLEAKRLLVDDGSEMVSAHLSAFAFKTPAAGAALVSAALAHCRSEGYPALFATVAEADATALRQQLAGAEVEVAPATIYAFGLDAGAPWNVNSAEI